MTGMDDGPQGRTTLRLDVDAAAADLLAVHHGPPPPLWPRCPSCTLDGCAALAWAVVWRAGRRDELVAAGVRSHPLLAW